MAVQQGSIGAFVYVVDDNDKVRIQRIVTGLIDDKLIAVESGLLAGQRVVVEGVDRLREGAAVEVVTDAPASGAASSSLPMAGSSPGPTTDAPGSPHYGPAVNCSPLFLLRP